MGPICKQIAFLNQDSGASFNDTHNRHGSMRIYLTKLALVANQWLVWHLPVGADVRLQK